MPIDSDGIIRSRVFPGLWLAVPELLAGNIQGVLAVLQEGVQSAEHAAFVQDLASDYSANCEEVHRIYPVYSFLLHIPQHTY